VAGHLPALRTWERIAPFDSLLERPRRTEAFQMNLRAVLLSRGVDTSRVAPQLPVFYRVETTHEETPVDDERDLEQLAAGGQAFLLMIVAIAALASALAVGIGGYLYQRHWKLGLVMFTGWCLWGIWKMLPSRQEAPPSSENISVGSVKL
jgi:hypothetical protein